MIWLANVIRSLAKTMRSEGSVKKRTRKWRRFRLLCESLWLFLSFLLMFVLTSVALLISEELEHGLRKEREWKRQEEQKRNLVDGLGAVNESKRSKCEFETLASLPTSFSDFILYAVACF